MKSDAKPQSMAEIAANTPPIAYQRAASPAFKPALVSMPVVALNIDQELKKRPTIKTNTWRNV